MFEIPQDFQTLESSSVVVLTAIFGIVAGEAEVAFSQRLIGPLYHIKVYGS